MKRLVIVAALLLAACRQEISSDAQLPVVTPLFFPSPTATATPLPTPIPPTPTLESFPPPSPLPAGPISMITIGDSLTLGEGDDTGLGYPGRLLVLVNQIRPGSSITNFGEAGLNSDKMIEVEGGNPSELSRAVTEVQNAAKTERGAVVMVWIGTNDIWNLYQNNREVTSDQEAQDVKRFETNITKILSQLRRAGAQVIIALLDDQSKRPAASGGETFNAVTPDKLAQMSMQVQRYNAVIQDKSKQYGTLTVDFFNSDIFTNPATLANDGSHPNDAGYDLITQAWYKQLITILP